MKIARIFANHGRRSCRLNKYAGILQFVHEKEPPTDVPAVSYSGSPGRGSGTHSEFPCLANSRFTWMMACTIGIVLQSRARSDLNVALRTKKVSKVVFRPMWQKCFEDGKHVLPTRYSNHFQRCPDRKRFRQIEVRCHPAMEN